MGWKETKITKNDNENVTVSKFEYNDQYYDVTDANWGTIFDQIADDVSNQAPTAPTDVTEGAEGTGGESGKTGFYRSAGKVHEGDRYPDHRLCRKKICSQR